MGTKRVRISFRRDRVIVIRPHASSRVAWCKGCRAGAVLLTAEEAAATAGVTPRTIYQWVEAGRVHFSETARGETLICLNSLSGR